MDATTLYLDAVRLMGDPDVTVEQARLWASLEAATIAKIGPEAADRAYRLVAQEHEDMTGCCPVCGGPQHDQEDF